MPGMLSIARIWLEPGCTFPDAAKSVPVNPVGGRDSTEMIYRVVVIEDWRFAGTGVWVCIARVWLLWRRGCAMCVNVHGMFFLPMLRESVSTCMIPRRLRDVVRRGLDGDVLEGG
jgi:hypothetical protein